jgi:hypothetical protein
MTKRYRIEINVFLNDGMRAKVIQAAREDYQNSGGAWTEENGRKVKIPVDEFVVDTKTAFLELAESAFRSALPGIEPHTFSCDVVNGATEVRARAAAVPSCRSRTRR